MSRLIDNINAEKCSRVTGEALCYLFLDWTNRNFKYEQEHLYPYDTFDGSKPISVSVENWTRWRGMRNRLFNIHLLEGRSNGSKNDMRLVEHYAELMKQAVIQDGVSLEIEDLEKFYELRKSILTERLPELLG